MILDRLVSSTKTRLAKQHRLMPARQMAARAEGVKRNRDFPFEKALGAPGISFICELKKASPSAGLISPDYPLLEIARAYEEAGARAISVLTEPDYFYGSTAHLQVVAKTSGLPTLRKDFLIDPYMVDEAAVCGASAVLLIARILDDDQLKLLIKRAHSLGLSALVEVHTKEDVSRALSAGARIIGVNNRDLSTFEVDLNRSIALRDLVPSEILFVAESGIREPQEVNRLHAAGVDAVLIGERLMRAEDKTAMLRDLSGGSDR